MRGAAGLKERVGKDPVLYISFLLALLSMLIVHPSEDYADYVDVRTLVILFCLMAVVSGISTTGAFNVLSLKLLRCYGSIRLICLVLVGLPFFLSMFITNDVSLITFVPFAILVLGMAGRRDLVIPVIVLQTLAANLGSMLLPFGNPQNIFIASKFGAGMWDFITATGPYVIAGAAVLFLMVMRVPRDRAVVRLEEGNPVSRGRLLFFLILFLLCIFSVIRVIPYWYVFATVLVGTILLSPSILAKVDWGLILTFVFLFVFTGNLASVDSVSDVLSDMMSDGSVVTSALVSQVISNVPAAIMLSNFTSDWSGLLAGVNIGGFGTPIASMASIITLRIYSKESDADKMGFMRVFLVTNAVMLVFLLSLSLII